MNPIKKSATKPIVKPATTPTSMKTIPNPISKPNSTQKSSCQCYNHSSKCDKLSPSRLGLAMGILFSINALIIHFLPVLINGNAYNPPKGNSLRYVLNDIYWGYNLGEQWYQVLILMAQTFIDGFLFAFLLACLYNWFSRNSKCKKGLVN